MVLNMNPSKIANLITEDKEDKLVKLVIDSSGQDVISSASVLSDYWLEQRDRYQLGEALAILLNNKFYRQNPEFYKHFVDTMDNMPLSFNRDRAIKLAEESLYNTFIDELHERERRVLRSNFSFGSIRKTKREPIDTLQELSNFLKNNSGIDLWNAGRFSGPSIEEHFTNFIKEYDYMLGYYGLR